MKKLSMGIVSDDLIKKIDKAPVGFLVFSGSFEIIHLSETFKKIADYYNFKFPQENLNRDIMDLEILREELNYLTLGYSFEKEIKVVSTPGAGKISLVMKGIPFYEGNSFSGGILTVEDFRLSEGEEILDNSLPIQEIIRSSGDYIFITDRSRKIRFSSGRKFSHEIIYQDVIDFIAESHQAELDESFRTVNSSRYSNKIITRVKVDPEEYECRIDPLLNKEGIPDFFLFTFNQVGAVMQELELLRSYLKNAEKFRAAADNADEMIYIYDPDFKLAYSNRKAQGLPDPAENIGTAEIRSHLENQPRYIAAFMKEGRTYEAVFVKFSEEHISCFCRERTSEIQELKRLKETNEMLRSVISGCNVLMVTISPSGNILFSNNYFRENFLTPNDNILDVIEKSYQPEFLIPDETIDKINIPLVSHGSVRTFSCSFKPVKIDFDVEYTIITGTDITQSAEDEKDRFLFREIINHAGDGIAVIRNSRIYLANKTFANLFGFLDENELREKMIDELAFVEDKEKIFEQLREIETSGFSTERFEFSGRKKYGKEFYVSASLASFPSGNSRYIIMICRDVTERRRVQKSISDSEEKFRNLTANIDDFLYTFQRINNRQKAVFYTESVAKITGYNPDEFLSDSRLIFKIVHPDDLAEVKRKLKVLFRSRIQLSEEFEFRIINRTGNIVWVRNKINLIRNNTGLIQRIYGLVSDVTLRKKAEDELKRSSENLVKLNDAKDRVISIISHDLRTPFSSILGFTDLLLNDDDLNEDEKRQYVKYVQESSKSMLALVNSLLDWTRIQTGRIRFEPEKFPAVSVIDEAIQVLSGSAWQKHIDLVNGVEQDIIIFADKGLLLQAFTNLISNAIKFTKPGGQIKVSVQPSDKIRFLQFSVKDNGMGIQEDNLKNLFRVETKFSTEGTAGEKGSGLGLSLVKEIVDKHGGTIWVESEYTKGSDFKFTIPLSPSNILLVDDSNTDRLLYSKLLKNFAPDYNIETASSGRDALEQISRSTPALVITDHLMPEMNGFEMYLQLKRLRLQELPPVVVLSSELDRNIISAYEDAGIEYIFQKPVNLVQFKQTIEKLLRKGYSRR